jgi:hypothetical protein
VTTARSVVGRIPPFRNPKHADREKSMIIRKPAIRALLIGSIRCDAAGFTARGRAPVTELCRVLLDAGQDPGRPLDVYRGDELSLIVRTIGEGARLTVKTAGSGCPVFAPYKVQQPRWFENRFGREVA